jgi:GTP cyclohydrolase I
MGLDLKSPGGRDTPRPWVAALWDMTEGYDGDPKLSTLFPVECPICPNEEKTHVVEGPIRFTGLCEHHVLPIRGSAWVGYLAAEDLIGISKLTRIVRVYSKRFTSQERLCHDIANELGSETADPLRLIPEQRIAEIWNDYVREISAPDETLVKSC